MGVNMKIVVLAGGNSPEREVSLCSGSLIANALIENGHRVILWDLCKELEDLMAIENMFLSKESQERYHHEIQTKETIFLSGGSECKKGGMIGKGVLSLCQSADAVFMALHGSIGENGKLQAVFDLMGIRYTGSGYLGSILAMDKELTKQLLIQNEIKTPKWISVKEKDLNLDKVEDFIGYPCVVKPASCGSSIGVKIVKNRTALLQALAEARQYEEHIIVEEMIVGREFSVGILDSNTLPAIEIIPRNGFYDYKNKYEAGLTSEICPANITKELEAKLESIALLVHKTLQLGYYSRVDLMVNYKDEVFVLEANTLPGMTPTSLLPQEAKAEGISYGELCEKILMDAILN